MSYTNQLKTLMLLSLLTAILLWVGSFWGTSGLVIAFIFCVGMNVGSYWFSDKIVLKMYKAKEVKSGKLYDMVARVAKQAHLPMPKVCIIPTHQPNAFATGRNPAHSAVACTEGIIAALTDDELEGVIAHELAHIKNRDTLITTIAATIAGVIAFIANMAQWAAIFGGGRDRDGADLIRLMLLIILTPLLATIIQLSISRVREFYADKTGASFTKNPNALASALEKLEQSHTKIGFGNESTASLFIVNPLKGKNFMSWFSTHPATTERVKRLREMSF